MFIIGALFYSIAEHGLDQVYLFISDTTTILRSYRYENYDLYI